jgi:Uncharacterized protein conserved in bacteria
MAERKLVYFVSDVHLGRKADNPEEVEARFLSFLRGLPASSTARLYLLGDIWDFWYEYRDVVPREGVPVVAELVRLMEEGVEVWFCPGNHDIWTFSLFRDLGIHCFEQPLFVRLGDREFCLGHGDLLGGAPPGYSLMLKVFHNRFLQRLFAALHPWLAYRLAKGWARSSRRKHPNHKFREAEEPLYRYALQVAQQRHVDYFVFGHYHDSVDLTLPGGEKFFVLKDWAPGGMPHAVFNGTSFELHSPASPAE